MRVVLVHGFTQTAASWETIRARLEPDFEVATVELPGHGARAHDRLGFVEAVHAIGAAGGPAAYVGYSMGGRLVLRLALDYPDLVSAAVLIGASPGIADPIERAQRRQADEELAARIERGGVERFLDDWLAQPLLAGLPADAAGLRERRTNTAAGLATALRHLGTGAQDPLWDRLPFLEPPALLLAGKLDSKYSAIAGEMADAVGSSVTVTLIDGSGHAVHLEKPDVIADHLRNFLTGLDESPAS